MPPASSPGFNCAAPFRGRLPAGAAAASIPTSRFNCAAPFRVRLLPVYHRNINHPVAASIVPPPSGGGYGKGELKCRPSAPASIVPPPSGGGYPAPARRATMTRQLQLCRPLPGAVTGADRDLLTAKGWRFNCAAPFRGRLLCKLPPPSTISTALQLCSPLPGAVTGRPCLVWCRWRAGFNCAAPFRGRLPAEGNAGAVHPGDASIVPPPSGGGYSPR